MSDMPQRQDTLTVPKEFAGKWIAWDFARSRIVASGRTLIEAKRAAESLGETHPVLAKVPPANVRFIGGKR
jgi:hypothetical protein